MPANIWEQAAASSGSPPPAPSAASPIVGPVQPKNGAPNIWEQAANIKPESNVLDDIGDTLKQYWDKASPVKQAQSVADTAASPLEIGRASCRERREIS